MRDRVKTLFQITSAIIIFPLFLLYFVCGFLVNKNGLLSAFSQFLSLLPGKVGAYIRAGFYRFALRDFEPDVVVSFMCLFSQVDIEVGSGVYIGPQCNIGMCKIGKDTLLGSAVHIMSGKNQHNFEDVDTPIRDQGGKFEKISIGENCWVGNGALIMANIGDNCIVAAGSVVTKDIPPRSIIAGNPAQVIKSR